MDPYLIPTIGGGVLLGAIWMGAIFGRAYVRRVQAAEARAHGADTPEDG